MEREEVSLIMRGNWSRPTVCRDSWIKILILVVGEGQKVSSSSAPHSPLKWDSYPISTGGSPPPPFCSPPTTEQALYLV